MPVRKQKGPNAMIRIIDNNNNTKSSYYDKIIPIYLNEKNEENVNYFILYDYKTIEILDLNTITSFQYNLLAIPVFIFLILNVIILIYDIKISS